jgi:hypothetical protein
MGTNGEANAPGAERRSRRSEPPGVEPHAAKCGNWMAVSQAVAALLDGAELIQRAATPGHSIRWAFAPGRERRHDNGTPI